MLAGLLFEQAGQPAKPMLINRVGTFFIWIGIGLIVLFVFTDIAQTPVCNLLIFGAIILTIGIVLWVRRPSTPHQPTGRFRILKSSKKKK